MLPIAISLTVGSRRYDQQCVGVRLRRTQLPALDRLEVLFPVAIDFTADAGEDCSLEWDGGDGAEKVFTGKLTQLTRSLSGLVVTAHNGGRDLAQFRPAASYEKLTAGEIIDKLCGEVGVTVARRPDAPTLALQVFDGRASAAEEIARLASWTGTRGAFDGDGELHVTEEGGAGAELALRYGREPVGIAASHSLDPGIAFTVVGDGAGDASSPEGRWVVTDFLGTGAPTPGRSNRRVPIPALRSTDDTEVAGKALGHELAAAGTPVRLNLWLNPKLEPGMRVELADLPDSIPASECRIRQVISTLWPGRPAITEVWATAQTAGASEFAGLLGGLL